MADQQTEQESLEVEKDYITEKVKSNYEQIKIYTAGLITAGKLSVDIPTGTLKNIYRQAKIDQS